MATLKPTDRVPKGFKEDMGAQTAPVGYKWYNNGKSRFSGEFKQVLVKIKDNRSGFSPAER